MKLAFALIALGLALSGANAEDLGTLEEKIRHVQSRIQEVSSSIGELSALMAGLEGRDKNLGDERERIMREVKELETRRQNTERRLRHSLERLAALEERILELDARLESHRRQVATAARLLYGHILVPRVGSYQVQRVFDELATYLAEQSRNLGDLRRARADHARRVQDLRGQLQATQGDLQQMRKRTDSIAARIKNMRGTVRERERRVAELYREKLELQRVFEQLYEKKRKFYSDIRRIAQYRGHLRPPARGTHSEAPEGGLYIAMKNDGRVYCIFDGDVVYKGSIRKYGNLIIVDHGDNYYSVYGGLMDVLVEEGDQVYANELLGSSLRLYFDIRHGRESLDPASWLRLEES